LHLVFITLQYTCVNVCIGSNRGYAQCFSILYMRLGK
jgi:hypothetical protein